MGKGWGVLCVAKVAPVLTYIHMWNAHVCLNGLTRKQVHPQDAPPRTPSRPLRTRACSPSPAGTPVAGTGTRAHTRLAACTPVSSYTPTCTPLHWRSEPVRTCLHANAVPRRPQAEVVQTEGSLTGRMDASASSSATLLPVRRNLGGRGETEALRSQEPC